jgi:membrane dipeptidase
MKKIDLHQDIILSFEHNSEWFVDSAKIVDVHGSYAGNLHDYYDTDTAIVWAANWPYHLEWDLSDMINRTITYDKYNILKLHAQMEKIAQHHAIGIIKNKNDLTSLKKFNIVHHVEGVDHIESIHDIKDLYDMGIRSIWFVWNFDNSLCRNNTSNDNLWLTDLGKEVVEFMNAQWMIVDTAHMNHQSMMDVVKISKKPILNSHSNIKTLYNHTRNVQDTFLDALVQNGWVIGLSVYSAFISAEEHVTVQDYFDQITYVRDRIGDDHVALGTDFHGLVTTKCIQWLQKISQLNNLEQSIVDRFWSTFAQKFFYENSMRVLQSNLQ